MPHPDEGLPTASIPPWALQQARDELYDVEDTARIAAHAESIARAAREREDERHNEYDDPDEGGEA